MISNSLTTYYCTSNSTNMASITKKYGDFIPPSRVDEIAALTQRSVSTMSDISVASTTIEFIDAKLESINAEIQLSHKLKEVFQVVKTQKMLAVAEYEEITNELKHNVSLKEREILRVKRQKKTIADDIDEVLLQYEIIEAWGAKEGQTIRPSRVRKRCTSIIRRCTHNRRRFLRKVLSSDRMASIEECQMCTSSPRVFGIR